MEIAWEGRPCGPKGCKGRKGLLLSSKHKWKIGNICFLHHTHISKENPSKPKFQSWQHFISPKPTFPSWKYLSPPNPNIKVEKHFTQDHDWKFEGFVFSTSPNFEVGSIRLSIRTRLLALVVFQKPRLYFSRICASTSATAQYSSNFCQLPNAAPTPKLCNLDT